MKLEKSPIKKIIMAEQDFYFLGRAPLSKSLLNRALIIKSWFPHFAIQGTSSCDDILIMTQAVEDLRLKKTKFYCGLSATAFRFLAVRLSREKGDFFLYTDPALLHRPLSDISALLSQLSVSINQRDKGFLISSSGWKFQGDSVHVPSQITSQYASALVLNSWNLNQDLYFSIEKGAVSYPYFQMTLDFAKSLGLSVQGDGGEFFIPKKQTLKRFFYTPEQDKSCLFALSCFSALKGQAVFLDWEENSLQPDSIFPKILKDMGVTVRLADKKLSVSKCDKLKPLSLSLKGLPDLFPLLCVLCAKAEGESELKNTLHLAFKESNRLNKIKELLESCGIKIKIQQGDFLIRGKKIWPKVSPFAFDTEKDHRMAMAAELVSALNAPVTVLGKEAVNKSFPEFYSAIQSVSQKP